MASSPPLGPVGLSLTVPSTSTLNNRKLPPIGDKCTCWSQLTEGTVPVGLAPTLLASLAQSQAQVFSLTTSPWTPGSLEVYLRNLPVGFTLS